MLFALAVEHWTTSVPSRACTLNAKALSPILLLVISTHSQGQECVQLGGLGIASLHVANDVVQLASAVNDLQHALEMFAAECEAAGIKICTSKSEAMVVCRKMVGRLLWVGGGFLF